jgi:hypothetical protein
MKKTFCMKKSINVARYIARQNPKNATLRRQHTPDQNAKAAHRQGTNQ